MLLVCIKKYLEDCTRYSGFRFSIIGLSCHVCCNSGFYCIVKQNVKYCLAYCLGKGMLWKWKCGLWASQSGHAYFPGKPLSSDLRHQSNHWFSGDPLPMVFPADLWICLINDNTYFSRHNVTPGKWLPTFRLTM